MNRLMNALFALALLAMFAWTARDLLSFSLCLVFAIPGVRYLIREYRRPPKAITCA